MWLNNLKHILSILTAYERKLFLRLSVFDIIISILDIVFLAALLLVINFYSNPSNAINRELLQGVPGNNPLLLITVFFVLFSIKNIAAYYITRKQYSFVYKAASRLSKERLLHFLRGDFMDFTATDSSVYIRKISQQPIEFGHYILRGVQVIITQSVLILFTIIAIMMYSTLLFSLLFLVLTPPVVLLAITLKKRLSDSRSNAKKTGEKALQHLKEALASYVESNIYYKHDFFSNRYHSYQSKLNHYLSEQQVIQNLPSRVIEVFAVFGLMVLVLLNSIFKGTESLHVITIGVFMAAAYKIIPGVVKIMNILGQVKTYAYTLTDMKMDDRKYCRAGIHHNIDSMNFENLSFGYNSQLVLSNFNMKIKKGDFVCISGRSASGKSTVLNLLLGFLKPAEGNIFINQPGRESAMEYWPVISYVKQQSFLVHDTVLKNIVLDEEDYDKERLESVANITGVNVLIAQHAEGFNYIITEDGKNISGGQRQRISLARALYKDFDLLLLDEPFNELDKESEQRLLQYFKDLSSKGKTIILVTHDILAREYCSQKIIMDEA